MSSVTLRWLSKKCKVANKQGNEAKPMSLAKTRTPPERVMLKGRQRGRSLGNPHGVGDTKGYVTRAPLLKLKGAPKVPHGTSGLNRTQRLRLSSSSGRTGS